MWLQRYKNCQQFTTNILIDTSYICCLWLQRYKNCQQFTTSSYILNLRSQVVCDYKDTKIVSNSQLFLCFSLAVFGCLWLQRYKNCQQFTTSCATKGDLYLLFVITKIQKLSAIHNYEERKNLTKSVVCDYKDTKIVSNSQPVRRLSGCKIVVCDYKDTKIVSNSQLKYY